MTTIEDRLEAARKKARRIEDEAKRESLIRLTLEEEYPDVVQPYSVHFVGKVGRKNLRPQVWAKWPDPPYARERKLTEAQTWGEARRLIGAFDWQTVGYSTYDGFTHVQPEDDFPAEADPETYGGPVLVLDGGKGYGPTVKVHVWTELAQHQNEGFIRVGYEIERDKIPAKVRPAVRYETRPDGTRRQVGIDPPQFLQQYASRVIRYGGSGDVHAYHFAFLFSEDGWDGFMDCLQAELGD